MGGGGRGDDGGRGPRGDGSEAKSAFILPLPWWERDGVRGRGGDEQGDEGRGGHVGAMDGGLRFR